MGNSVRVDEKGRLKIPANLVVALKKSETEFYVTSECGDSIRIYPMQVWNQFEQKLERLCLRNRNYQKFLARAKYFGQVVTIDNQGRMLIPMSLRRSAQIKGTVVVLDYLGYLEVWNQARLLKSLRSNPITAQDENMLNKQLSSVVRFPSHAHAKQKKAHIHGKTRRFGLYRRASRLSHSQGIRSIRGSRQALLQRARVA
jgi:MraZ protein